MAIIKPFETPQGVEATYHKLLKAEVRSADKTIEFTVAVYASPEARAAGKGALWHVYPCIPFADLSQDPLDTLYTLLTSYAPSYLFSGNSDVAPPPDPQPIEPQ